MLSARTGQQATGGEVSQDATRTRSQRASERTQGVLADGLVLVRLARLEHDAVEQAQQHAQVRRNLLCEPRTNSQVRDWKRQKRRASGRTVPIGSLRELRSEEQHAGPGAGGAAAAAVGELLQLAFALALRRRNAVACASMATQRMRHNTMRRRLNSRNDALASAAGEGFTQARVAKSAMRLRQI